MEPTASEPWRQALIDLLDEAFDGPAAGAEYGAFTTGPGTGLVDSLRQSAPERLSLRPHPSRPSAAAHGRHVLDALRSLEGDLGGDAFTPDWNAAWNLGALDAEGRAKLLDGLGQAHRRLRQQLAHFAVTGPEAARTAVSAVVHTAYHLGALRQILLFLDSPPVGHALLAEPFVPYGRALEGLSGEQATRVPDGAPYSPAQVLGHMVFWQDWYLRRARGEEPATPDHAREGWPEVASEAWPQWVARFRSGLEEARSLAARPEVRCRLLGDQTTGDAALTELALHNGHHLGQVILLRRQLGSWPPPGGGDTW